MSVLFPANEPPSSVVLSIGSGVLQRLIGRQDRIAIGIFPPDEKDLRYRLINQRLSSSAPVIGMCKDALP
jgi:hypothetical protein